MKRNALILCALVLVVVTCCVFAAGCTSQDTAYQPDRVYDLENQAYTHEFVEYLQTRTDYPYAVGETLYFRDGLTTGHPSDFSFNGCPGGMVEEIYDIGDVRVSIMDEAGITTAVISCSPGVEEVPREEAVKYARQMNDAVAEAMKKYPGRILGAITLPTPYVNESIAELERCVNELGLQYWHTYSNYGYNGDRLSDAKFEPLLAKCEELDVPIYIHPNFPITDYLLDSGAVFGSAGFGFSVDAMKTVLNLILSGTLDQHPDLTIILGHLGEYFPYALDRMDNRFAQSGDSSQQYKENISYYFKNNIYLTTSGITQEDSVLLALNSLGSDRILFGSDYPYENVKSEVDFIKSLPISDEDKDKILYKNAEQYILKDRTSKSA
ncbi:MAG TPA: amidohydrolase family protein [Methanocorpusculum sp.]|nr:amidohydrolase family protein [Methanocorpusculum sp.]